MSRIISRTPTRYEVTVLKGTMCDKCGCGDMKETKDGPCTTRRPTKCVWDSEKEQHVAVEFGPVCTGTRRYDEREYKSKVPGELTLRCDCGAELHATIGQFTITCDKCHADYNSSGSRLAPRSQWGEETGETAGDILMVDAMSPEELLDGEG